MCGGDSSSLIPVALAVGGAVIGGMVGGPTGAAAGASWSWGGAATGAGLGLAAGGAVQSATTKQETPNFGDIPMAAPLPSDPGQSEEAQKAVAAARARRVASTQDRTQTVYTSPLGATGTVSTLKKTLGG